MRAISGFRQGFGAPQSPFTRSFRGWWKSLWLVRKAVHRLHSELADAEVGAFPAPDAGTAPAGPRPPRAWPGSRSFRQAGDRLYQSRHPRIGTACSLNPRDLMATARGLAEGGPRRPSQANLRRAVGTAYYALFHCLAGTAADLLIGGNRSEAWHQVYRALEHGSAKSACRNRQAMQRFPLEVQDFADTFAPCRKRVTKRTMRSRAGMTSWMCLPQSTGRRMQSSNSSRPAFNIVAASLPMCCSSGGHRRRSNMNERQIREIAETAFKRHFGDVEIVRVNVEPGFDHDEAPSWT